MPSLPAGLVEVWDYLAAAELPHHPIGTADAILCLGSANLGTARRGAVLFAAGVAPTVVVSGGVPWAGAPHRADPHDPHPPATEADAFARELRDRGVPGEALVWDRRSTNTGENARFAVEALEATGVSPGRLVVVCFPTLVRRATATFALGNPDIAVRVVPSFDTFGDYEEPPRRAVALVVAEVRRLVDYPRRGLIAPVEVPHWVQEATARLSGELSGSRLSGELSGAPGPEAVAPGRSPVPAQQRGFPLSP